MDPSAPVASAASAGAQLCSAREGAGLTLAQAAELLHLDINILKYLEDGQFQRLGAAVFARGHLRRYADMLGVPFAQLDEAIAASSKMAVMPDLRRTATPLASGARARRALGPRSALLGAVIVVLIGLVWWAMRMPQQPPHGVLAPASALGGASAPAGAAHSLGGADSPASSGAELRAPAAVPASATHAAPQASSGPATAGQMRLGLQFHQDSWAEIYDARGQRLFYELGAAGSQRRLSGQAPLQILLGNPEGVTLEVDGHAVSLSDEVASNNPVRFSLDGGGRIIELRSEPSVEAAHPLQP